ncbi:RNA polymerase I subunit RPA34.5 [Botryosphaeria dothidea]|uniref:RNA polymerase I subunit RPA34.5 n=1 Tax=Botryosphaeria dothidea TaxID=55169 RepID=A0A8H4IRZ1_9PEZI|nr:RNA polymerase I subunit RPA34.5 [Botryosphaeria dothidea]
MSAVKRTRIPLPGQARAASSTPSKPPKPVSKPAPQDDDSSSDKSSSSSGSGSDNESVAAKTNGAKKSQLEKATEAEPGSSSEVSDSSEEEDEDEEESSEEAEDIKKSEAPKTAETTKNAASREEASGSESSSEESESESEDESEDDAPAKSAQTSSSSRLQTAQFRPAHPFEPPSGFKLIKSGLNPSSKLAKLLQSTDLSKKQIWHITAPADVDIKQIKQFARDGAALKKPAIEHKGVGYAFVPEQKDTRISAKLLVPTEKGYSAVPAEISETLHLQQIVNIPKLSENKAESSRSSGVTQKFVERPWKPARPQPEGLRMRYKPYGYSGDMEGAIGFDDGAITVASKRKHGDTTDATALKKSKKDKKHKEKSRQDDGEAGEPMEGVEATAAAEESEKRKKKKKKKKEGKEA